PLALHDALPISFEGRARIAELIDDWFYKDARDFLWDMHEPVSDGDTLYARYVFSYVSTLPGAGGRRVAFEGVSIMRLRDGLIREYREVAKTGPAVLRLGFSAERGGEIFSSQADALGV